MYTHVMHTRVLYTHCFMLNVIKKFHREWEGASVHS